MHSRIGLLLLAVVLGIPLLSGCKADLIRAETSDYVAKGKEAADATKTFYDDLLKADHQYYDTQLALEPACGVPDPLPAIDDTHPLPSTYQWSLEAQMFPAKLPLDLAGSAAKLRATPDCADYIHLLEAQAKKSSRTIDAVEKEIASEGWRVCIAPNEPIAKCYVALSPSRKLDILPLHPLNETTFAIETATLKVLMKYLAALGDLAADPKSKVGDELKTAASDLDSIKTIAGASKLSDAANDKIKAIGGLVDGIRQIAKAAEQADQIRDKVKKEGPAISARVRELADTTDVEVLSLEAMLRAESTYLEKWLKSSDASEPAMRSRVIEQYASNEAARVALAKARRLDESCKQQKSGETPSMDCIPGESSSSRLLRASAALHDDLTRIISDGTLTPEERKRQAHLAWKRFAAFASSIADLVSAFAL